MTCSCWGHKTPWLGWQEWVAIGLAAISGGRDLLMLGTQDPLSSLPGNGVKALVRTM